MSQLRLLHIVITLSASGVAIALGVMGMTRASGDLAVPAAFEWALFGISALILLIAAIFRSRFPAVDTALGMEQWEKQNRPRCVILWAMLEASVFVAAIALFLGANPVTAGALAAGGLGFLASQSPGTLAGH